MSETNSNRPELFEDNNPELSRLLTKFEKEFIAVGPIKEILNGATNLALDEMYGPKINTSYTIDRTRQILDGKKQRDGKFSKVAETSFILPIDKISDLSEEEKANPIFNMFDEGSGVVARVNLSRDRNFRRPGTTDNISLVFYGQETSRFLAGYKEGALVHTYEADVSDKMIISIYDDPSKYPRVDTKQGSPYLDKSLKNREALTTEAALNFIDAYEERYEKVDLEEFSKKFHETGLEEYLGSMSGYAYGSFGMKDVPTGAIVNFYKTALLYIMSKNIALDIHEPMTIILNSCFMIRDLRQKTETLPLEIINQVIEKGVQGQDKSTYKRIQEYFSKQ